MVEAFNVKNNSLNTFRLIAAIQVLWIHTLNHMELPNIPVLGDFIVFFSGVPIFFTLSGFLIWHSIGRSKTFYDYAKKRFWRIYPELWVAVTIEVLAILFFYRHPIDWPMLGLFTVGQSTIFQFWTPDFLRGYGCGTPNGALWTITVLIQFYFCAFFVYKWLHNKKIAVWGGVILISVFIGWLTPQISNWLPLMVAKVYGVTLIPYFWMFIVAAFFAEFRDKFLPLFIKYWWVFIALLLFKKYIVRIDITMNTDYALLGVLLLFVGVIGFAYKYPKINIKTDISYGIYIYHMTIVNALIALGFVGQGWTLWLIVALTCLAAWLSTVTIGRFSAHKKQTL